MHHELRKRWFSFSTVLALGPIDVKSVRRDSLIRWMLATPLALALVIRFGLPPTSVWAQTQFELDLEPYLHLFGSALITATPLMFGTVVGFLLIDQKDDQTLTALQVTPLTNRAYLLYRLGVPCLLSVPLTVLALRLSGIPQISLGRQLVAAAVASPLVAAFSLFLAALANNKLQGFAIMKGSSGVINLPPIIAWFVDSNWQWAFGIAPMFWPLKLYWVLAGVSRGPAAPAWVYALVGVAYLLALIALLGRRFDRVMHR